MKLFIVLAVCVVGIFGYKEDTKIDFEIMKKQVAKMQSALDKECAEEFSAALEGAANSMPDDVVFYGMGISVGKRVDFTLVRTPVLYGTKYVIPLNPARRVDSDCVYVDNRYSGSVVIVTEEPAEIKTCSPSDFRKKTTSLPFHPIYADRDVIRTSSLFSPTATHSFSYGVRTNKDFKLEDTVAVDAEQINPSTFADTDRNWILAGSIVSLRFGQASVKYLTVAHSFQIQKGSTIHAHHHGVTPDLAKTLSSVLTSAGIPIPKNLEGRAQG